MGDVKFAFLKIPCPTEEFFLGPTFVIVTTPFWTNYLVFSTFFAALVLFVESAYFTFSCFYHLYVVGLKSRSPSTIRYQRVFFRGIMIQVSIPFVFYAIPYSLMLLVILLDIYDQAINNLFIFVYSLHGFASTLAVLLTHGPYRKYVLSIVSKRFSYVESFDNSNRVKVVSLY
uniref:Serpentine Receptor, class H n=1 Tax=Caenorhabditis japonica TaxID=281687 RepID=A0A8R1E115_CAEJA